MVRSAATAIRTRDHRVARAFHTLIRRSFRPLHSPVVISMAKREFRDNRGITWMVWEVHPTMAERRKTSVPIPPDYKERRLNHQVRVPMDQQFAGGWLVFRTAGERRRLVPIPNEWSDGSEDQLRTWCNEAAPTVVWRHPVGRQR